MKTVWLWIGLAMGVLMATAFDVLLDTGRLLEQVREGTATADGTATTLVDTHLSTAEGHANDEWNGGSLFWKDTRGGAVSIASESVGSVSADDTFADNLIYVPVLAGSVGVTTPAGALTDGGAGLLTGPTATVTNEAVTTTATGTLAHGSVVPGSVVLTGSTVDITDNLFGELLLGSGGDGGPVIGTIDYATGAWAITTPVALPYLAEYTAGVTDYTEALTLTAGDSLAHRFIVQGSVTLTYRRGLSGIAATVVDNGNGVFQTGDGDIGTLDYETGAWTLDDATFVSFTYTYRLVTGTIVYTTGYLTLAFESAQTGAVTASYTGSTSAVFLPLIARTTDFVVSTGTVTFENESILATKRGDGYGLMSRRYPRWLLFQKLNEALREIKQYVLDSTDIPTASLVQNETALADSVRVFAVWNGDTATTPRDWRRITRYAHVHGRLQFYDYLTGDTIRVQYFGDATPISTETATIPATLDPMWLAYETAVKCARWRLFQPGADKEALTMLVNDLMARRDRQKAKANVINPNPSALKTAILPER